MCGLTTANLCVSIFGKRVCVCIQCMDVYVRVCANGGDIVALLWTGSHPNLPSRRKKKSMSKTGSDAHTLYLTCRHKLG